MAIENSLDNLIKSAMEVSPESDYNNKDLIHTLDSLEKLLLEVKTIKDWNDIERISEIESQLREYRDALIQVRDSYDPLLFKELMDYIVQALYTIEKHSSKNVRTI